MSILQLDQRPHAVAIKAAIKVQFGPNNVYEYGQVPGADGVAGTLPNIFAVISLERRNQPLVRSSSRAGSVPWRLAVTSIGRTVDECRWAQLKVAVALTERRLLVADTFTTRIQFESGRAAASDDGRFSADDIYTFTH